MTMEEAIEQLQARDTKERLAGVERLQTLLDHSRKGLSANEVSNLVDASVALLRDNNFKVCQGTLHALTSAAAVSGELLKLHFNQLVPAVVERLGDSKQTVRDAGRRLLLALMEISSPSTIADRAGSYAWGHKNWRVREEFTRTVASAFNLFSATELPLQRLLLPAVLQLLEDSNSNVRESAMLCLEEMYRQGGQHFKEELQRYSLRPTQIKDIAARFDRIEPVRRSINEVLSTSASSRHIQPNSYHALSMQQGATATGLAATNQHAGSEPKATHAMGGHRRTSPQRRCSPKAKPILPPETFVGGDSEGTEKPVDPIRVFSEKELTKEMEKVASLLTAEQEWSVRMAAMQKMEGLVAGGATEFSCFLTLFRQLVGPLSVQLSDRRSSIVKQACQLLNMLSKELRADFESFAEAFIPVLFKLVVITVLVIAESADNCIKTMLRNCRVARVLPRIIECAKHDRNAVLRARCCEYALLVLERWAESPEMQRTTDLYEDLIRFCSGDAMGEVRSTARMCYRVFARFWPDRARRVFSILDPAIQKLINEEEGGAQKRYTSPAVRDRGCYNQQQLRHSTGIPVLSGQDFAGGTTHERSKSLVSGPGSLNAANSLQRKSMDMPPERNLQKMLQASQHQVKAMEGMLKGVDSDENVVATTVDRRDPVGGSYRKIHAPASAGTVRVSIDPPSARDPPHPASAPASSNSGVQPSMVGTGNLSGHNNGTSPMALQAYAGPETGKEGLYSHGMNRETGGTAPSSTNLYAGGPLVGPQGARRILLSTERSAQSSSMGESGADKGAKRIPKPEAQLEKLRVADMCNGGSGFQRPNLRHPGSGRSSGSSSSLEDNHLMGGLNPYGDALNYMDGLMSLNDALTEGLGPSADWSARVAAFTYLRKLLQQGSKGMQEVGPNFERVMKLFSEHLDDPHWKVAQAALAALIELVPACRRLFEPYLERTLPSVFARLVDTKDKIRQLGSSALDIIGNTYIIDSLLPSLLRSLDEQRTPKARMAVIEFAISAFAKLALNEDGAGSTGLLKLWLGKLAPLANDKNPKLRETSIKGIISVYSHFDSTIVLNFILGLSIEEQSNLRRALKQFTPRIDLDLMAYLQNKCQRPRVRCVPEQTDGPTMVGPSGEATGRALSALSSNSPVIGGYSSLSPLDGGCKWGPNQPELRVHLNRLGHQQPPPNEFRRNLSLPGDLEPTGNAGESSEYSKTKEMCNGVCGSPDRSALWVEQTPPNIHHMLNGTHGAEPQGAVGLEHRAGVGTNSDAKWSNEAPADVHKNYADAHLQRKLDHKLPNPQQPASTVSHQFHQGDKPGSLEAPKAVASRHLTKRILLAALKQSPSNIGVCQRISYSSLYSRLPTK